MSLAPGEEQMLTGTGGRLRRPDRRLAARLAVLRRRVSRGSGPARVSSPPGGPACSGPAIYLALLAVLPCVGVVIGPLSSGGF